MHRNGICVLLALAVMTAFLPMGSAEENLTVLQEEWSQAVEFRPVDCGVQPQETYEYPFIGLKLTFPQTLLDQMESREVYVSQDEDYTENMEVACAMMRFYATTQAQREQKGESVDIFAWEDSLEKVGVLGAYRAENIDQLDALTGCEVHAKLGESLDGTFQYYLSTASEGDASIARELSQIALEVTAVTAFDPEYYYSAFSTAREENVPSVGTFETQDVFGKAYSQDVFSEYDLTLVNVFATWCSPCIEEIPALEELRSTYAEQGVRFNVVGVVMDAVTEIGIDEGAIERAQQLSQSSGIQFPLLIPDEGDMNGRLKGLESFPESFFVDQDGNIIGEAYMGARTLEEWKQIVETQLQNAIKS